MLKRHGNTGKIRSKATRKKLSEIMKGTRVGNKNVMWKGDNASSDAMHKWVAQWKGKPMSCEFCGCSSKKRYGWANVDHKYRRVLDDYIRLCTPCHRSYDINNNNYPTRVKKGTKGFIKEARNLM